MEHKRPMKLHKRNMKLDDLQTFVRVVETGSFTKAAELLGVPKSTVSRRVSRLEDGLGVELLARKARSFTVTGDGQQLHARVAPALRDITDVERELSGAHESIRGSLRITAPHDLGASDLFAELLASFTHRWPDVVPHVELTMRTVDLLEEGFDVALRARSATNLPNLEGIMVRRFRNLSGRLFASPRYASRFTKLEDPEDLEGVRMVGFSVRPTSVPLRHVETGERRTIEFEPVAVGNDLSLVAKLLQHEVGVGFVPNFIADALVSRGELVPILPAWQLSGGELAVLWPASRHVAPRVRSFIDFAIAFLDEALPHT